MSRPSFNPAKNLIKLMICFQNEINFHQKNRYKIMWYLRERKNVRNIKDLHILQRERTVAFSLNPGIAHSVEHAARTQIRSDRHEFEPSRRHIIQKFIFCLYALLHHLAWCRKVGGRPLFSFASGVSPAALTGK